MLFASSMEIKAARRFSERTYTTPYQRPTSGNQTNKPCKFWLSGGCRNNQCRFLHDSRTLTPTQSHSACKVKPKLTWENPDYHKFKRSQPGGKIADDTIKQILRSNEDWSKKRCLTTIEQTPPKSEINECKKKSIQMLELKPLKSEINETAKKSIQKAEQKPLKSEKDGCGYTSVEKTWQTFVNSEADGSRVGSVEKVQQKLCSSCVTGSCDQGVKCQQLHSWFYGNGLSMLATLEGHTKAVTGIALPSGCSELFCGSQDKSIRVFDCNSGKCARVADLGIECGTLVCEGPWIFAGLPNAVKVWNLQARSEQILQGANGQVYAIDMFNDTLFAGIEDGTILSWKTTSETSFSEVGALLKGHTHAVLSLVVGANMLFSGSADHTIRVWDAKSLDCLHILTGHTRDVTAVLCWDSYLLSGSLDNTIKVWAATESGNLEVVYEHNEDDGVLELCGIHDAEHKPILLCSCKDNSTRLHELPSFIERGRIFSKGEVQVIEPGPRGLFFMGDTTGQVSVWKMDGESKILEAHQIKDQETEQ